MVMYRQKQKEEMSFGRGEWVAQQRAKGLDMAGTYDGVIVFGKVDSKGGTLELVTNRVGPWMKLETSRVSVPFEAVEELMRFERARLIVGE